MSSIRTFQRSIRKNITPISPLSSLGIVSNRSIASRCLSRAFSTDTPSDSPSPDQNNDKIFNLDKPSETPSQPKEHSKHVLYSLSSKLEKLPVDVTILASNDEKETLLRNIQKLLNGHSKWLDINGNPTRQWEVTKNGNGIERNFRFESRDDTASFIVELLKMEEYKHYEHDPEIASIDRRVLVRWTTHHPKPGAISAFDVEGAKMTDELANTFQERCKKPDRMQWKLELTEKENPPDNAVR